MGGQEMVVDELARQYQQLGHSVVLLSPEPPHHLKANDSEFPYRIERHPRFISTRWFVSWYELALKRLYREFKYDIIHCHNVYPNGYLAVKHKLRGGPPVVITSHGGDVRNDNPRFKKHGLKARHQLAVQQADALVAIGPFTEQGYLNLGAKPQRIENIGNGVHAESLLEPVDRPEIIPSHVRSKKYILFVGRLAHRKGVDVLLRAAAQHLRSLPNQANPPHYVICGDGTERESLQALSIDLGLKSFVTFMGNVRGTTKQWLLQQAFSMVIPSRQWEAYPMVLLEGFAAGCPIIASDAPGLQGLVNHGENGWVFPRENTEALAEMLGVVWNNPSINIDVAHNGLQVARKCEWSRIAERHVELFEKLTGQRQQFTLRLAA
ncbi:MAG: glycosyltransferase family 4 protein [Gemmatales bacterium]